MSRSYSQEDQLGTIVKHYGTNERQLANIIERSTKTQTKWFGQFTLHIIIIILFAVIYLYVVGAEAIHGTMASRKIAAQKQADDEIKMLVSKDTQVLYLSKHNIKIPQNIDTIGIDNYMIQNRDAIARSIDENAYAEQSWIGRAFEAFYFSVISHTTIGYSDFYPTTSIARGVACCQALIALGILL
jgi:hypothetical protein